MQIWISGSGSAQFALAGHIQVQQDKGCLFYAILKFILASETNYERIINYFNLWPGDLDKS